MISVAWLTALSVGRSCVCCWRMFIFLVVSGEVILGASSLLVCCNYLIIQTDSSVELDAMA